MFYEHYQGIEGTTEEIEEYFKVLADNHKEVK
jgi:hypothetical protein